MQSRTDREEKQPWREALKAFADSARENLREHPEPRELLLFAEGGLDTADRADLGEHLAVCPDCLRFVVERQQFPLLQPPADHPRLSDQDIEDRWRIFQERVSQETEAMGSPVPNKRRSPTPFRTAFVAVAAMTAAALIGFAVLRPRLPVPSSSASRPVANVAVHLLLPDEIQSDQLTRSQGSPTSVFSLGPTEQALLLTLSVRTLEDFPRYKGTLVAKGSAIPLWEDPSLQRAEDLSFSIYFPRGALPPGDYSLSISGEVASGWQTLATYHFQIEHSTP